MTISDYEAPDPGQGSIESRVGEMHDRAVELRGTASGALDVLLEIRENLYDVLADRAS